MALPTAYLTTAKNLEGILMAIRNAQAPPKFTRSFLEGIGYTSSSDRLILNVLKALGFLAPSGEPTERYIRYLDPEQSGGVLAEGIREAYADLFRVNGKAQDMTRPELKGKMKVLAQGKLSDAVADKMATTFSALCKAANWAIDSTSKDQLTPDASQDGDSSSAEEDSRVDADVSNAIQLGGLVYNIQIHLPESRDSAVYDALFKSLRTHLVR